jgi:hypothetical protein
MVDSTHIHDCTGPDMRCPCGYTLRIPPVCVSIEVSNGREELINTGFNCEDVATAVQALRDAADRLERGVVGKLRERVKELRAAVPLQTTVNGRVPLTPLVHLVNWASQPDLQLWCSGEMTTPKWGKKAEGSGVFLAQNDQIYTFDKRKVTCRACLEKP